MKKNSHKNFCKLKGLAVTFVFSFILPFLCFFYVNKFILSPSVFSPGTSLCGVDVGNLAPDKAKEKILTEKLDEENISLTITYEDKTWAFSKSDFEIDSKVHTILDELEKSHRRGTSGKALIRKIKRMGFNDEQAVKYTLIGIEEKIDKIANEIETRPVCARANFSKSSFSILPSKTGQELDRQKLYADIASSLSSDFKTIHATTHPVIPEFVEEDILRATKLQAEFSTKYSSSSSGRKNNINLATQALNNTEILPNETFSFNDIVGRRTTEKGYKSANIIKDGAFVSGIGGGICQVSSTLYNALLHANITVDESHKHSLPVSYVKPGFDAMVSWNGADLKFKNTTQLPIYINAIANNETITFKVYGDTNPENLVIKTRSEIVKTIPAVKDKIIPDSDGKFADKIMFKGEFIRVKSSKNGYEVQSFIDYLKDGKLVLSKPLRHATYEPQQGILYEGCEVLPKSLILPKEQNMPDDD